MWQSLISRFSMTITQGLKTNNMTYDDEVSLGGKKDESFSQIIIWNVWLLCRHILHIREELKSAQTFQNKRIMEVDKKVTQLLSFLWGRVVHFKVWNYEQTQISLSIPTFSRGIVLIEVAVNTNNSLFCDNRSVGVVHHDLSLIIDSRYALLSMNTRHHYSYR